MTRPNSLRCVDRFVDGSFKASRGDLSLGEHRPTGERDARVFVRLFVAWRKRHSFFAHHAVAGAAVLLCHCDIVAVGRAGTHCSCEQCGVRYVRAGDGILIWLQVEDLTVTRRSDTSGYVLG